MRKYLLVAGPLALVAAGTFFALHAAFSADKRHDALREAAASLKSSNEITVIEAEPSLATPISRAQAIKKATRETSFLGGDLDSAHLIYLTDPYFGKQTSNADGAPITPFSQHRLTWLVLFRHATAVPHGGPEGGQVITTQVAVAAFVDAHTGALISASTIKDLS